MYTKTSSVASSVQKLFLFLDLSIVNLQAVENFNTRVSHVVTYILSSNKLNTVNFNVPTSKQNTNI